tara:strand:- start:2630 stop:4309 length:1680 start_codon:yes stop_codon:yes gene_type:complete
MADQVKQLAFKEFTTTELNNGTPANMVTTDSSTHYVIKSIEATQTGSTAITATATLGLTSGLATDQYTTLGTLKQNRLGLSGSAIMDASSTLTIRPTAVSVVYADETVFQGTTGSTSETQYVRSVRPTINGIAETALNTETSIDRSSVSYAGGSYNSMSPYASSNYTIEHTNANGVDLRIVFGNGSSSGAFFEVWNADGTYYGYYNSSYDTPLFDGERYIFWVGTNGASNTRVFWYDLDESTTNLLAANTTGGGNSNNFWHGQTAVWADSPSINSRTTYDNHLNAFCKNRTNGKRYITGWSRGNFRCWICELPDTLTNDSSTTPTVKWLYLNSGSQQSSGTSPFGQNGSAWNMDRVFASAMTPTDQSQYRLTFDSEKSRFYLWYAYNNHYWVCFTFSQQEFDDRTSGNLIDVAHSSSQGLFLVATAEFADINLASAYFVNWSSSNGYVDLQGSSFNNASGGSKSPFSNGAVHMDGKNWYFKNGVSNNPDGYYRKCIKVDMSVGSAAGFTNMFPNTTITATYNPDLFVGFGAPSASTIASRTYANAPSFKVRITGILSDQ